MSRPAIGITVDYQERERPGYSLPGDYVQSVLRAGGVPVLLPPVQGEEQAGLLLERVGGLLLSGGGDLDPAAYGEEPHPKSRPLHPLRSRFELTVARVAAERGLPVMGICLGCQVLNVTLGGTLYQHLPDQVPAAVAHRGGEPGQRAFHRVRIDPESHLARILGATDLQTNSFHHQAIREVAPALRPVAWSEDGLVEAAEARDHRFILAIQWHPENLASERAEHLALFAALVRSAGGGGGEGEFPCSGPGGGVGWSGEVGGSR